MPDIQMCQSTKCLRSHECRRHQDSGTQPHKFSQAWGDFTAQPFWDSDNCWGFWPLHAQRCGPAGVYGGKGLI